VQGNIPAFFRLTILWPQVNKSFPQIYLILRQTHYLPLPHAGVGHSDNWALSSLDNELKRVINALPTFTTHLHRLEACATSLR
jgi:hypothetical protein